MKQKKLVTDTKYFCWIETSNLKISTEFRLNEAKPYFESVNQIISEIIGFQTNFVRSNFLVFIVKHKLSPTQPKLIFFSAISGRNLSPVRSFVLHYSHTCLLYFYLHPLLHSQNQILFNWHNKVFYKLARFSKWHFNLKVQKGRKQWNYIILFCLGFFLYLKYDFKTTFVCGLFC